MINIDISEYHSIPEVMEILDFCPAITYVNISAHLFESSNSTALLTLLNLRKIKIGLGLVATQFSNPNHYSTQLQLAIDIAHQYHINIHHIKALGPLYWQSIEDENVANQLVESIKKHSSILKIMTKQDSILHHLARRSEIGVLFDVLADRRYRSDGNSLPISEHNSLYQHASEIIYQYDGLVNGVVTTTSGYELPLMVDTISFDLYHAPSIKALKMIHQ